MLNKETKARALIVAADKPRAIFFGFMPLKTNIVIKPKIRTSELNLTKNASAKTKPVRDANATTLGKVFCFAAVAANSTQVMQNLDRPRNQRRENYQVQKGMPLMRSRAAITRTQQLGKGPGEECSGPIGHFVGIQYH